MKKSFFTKLLAVAAMASLLVAAGCSSDSSGGDESASSSSGNTSSSANPSVETVETGSVSVTVNVDGTVSCSKCGKTYELKSQAENCEHYKCETCGTSYCTQEECDECVSHVTVIFKDADGAADAYETVTNVIKTGEKASVPEWTKEHYTLGWSSSVDRLSADSEITEDVTFTAVWTEDAKYTVTFVDSEGNNTEVTQTVYTGEKASVPEWTKENYVLSWACSVDGLSTDSAITQDVTFTANWTEKPKCSSCGTYYDTETEAENCSKEEGCPKYGTLTTITFSGTKAASAVSDNSAITVSMTGNIKSNTTLTYNAVTYTPIIKMESSTVITVSGAAGKTIKVVCDAAKAITAGSTNYTAVADGTAYVATFTAPDGDSFVIKKKDSVNVGVIFIE